MDSFCGWQIQNLGQVALQVSTLSSRVAYLQVDYPFINPSAYQDQDLRNAMNMGVSFFWGGMKAKPAQHQDDLVYMLPMNVEEHKQYLELFAI